jgi:hypothetical protein
VAAAVDPRFKNGLLAIVDCGEDGQVSAYCVGGLILDMPAKSISALVEWTLKEPTSSTGEAPLVTRRHQDRSSGLLQPAVGHGTAQRLDQARTRP